MNTKIFYIFLSFVYLCEASTKKGVCVAGGDQYLCGDEQAFTTAHWWYDWRRIPTNIVKNCTTTPKPGHVPLIWGQGKWAATSFNLSDDVQYVLGFNEPNHPEQANMTPETAANFWKEIENSAQGKVLVSPSAAPCGNCQYSTIQWFDEFFRLCHDCRVDHIATHFYSCNADKTMAFLRQLWKRYRKPIWLTEFACPYTNSVNTQLAYMQQILPRLESARYVFRYAWFVSRKTVDGFVTSSASLLQQDSSQFTTLGHFYNNF